MKAIRHFYYLFEAIMSTEKFADTGNFIFKTKLINSRNRYNNAFNLQYDFEPIN